MFTELLKQKTPVTDTLYLRFDINSFISAELAGINIFDINNVFTEPKKAVELLKIGLADCLNSLGISEPLLSEIAAELIALPDISDIIASAITGALPEPIRGAAPSKSGKPADMRVLRSRYVDIMGRSDEEFLSSTLREVLDRWDKYAIFHGYKKAPQTFRQYDDD